MMKNRHLPGFPGRRSLWALVLALLFFFHPAGMARGEEKQGAAPQEQVIFLELEQAVNKSLKEAKDIAQNLAGQVQALKGSESAFQAEISAYRLQLAAYDHVLLLPEFREDDLQQIYAGKSKAMAGISQSLTQYKDKKSSIAQSAQQAVERLKFWESQKEQLAGQAKEGPPVPKNLTKLLAELTDQQTKNKELYGELDSLHTDRIKTLNAASNSFSDFTRRLDERSKTQTRQRLFDRTTRSLGPSKMLSAAGEISGLIQKAMRAFSFSYGKDGILPAGKTDWSSMAVFSVTLVLAFLFSWRIAAAIRRQEDKHASQITGWRFLAIRLVRRYMALYLLVLFVLGCERMHLSWPSASLFRLAYQGLLIWIFSGWMICLIRFASQEFSAERHFGRWQPTITTMRYVGLACLLFTWSGGMEATLGFVARLLIACVLLLWSTGRWQAPKETGVWEGVRLALASAGYVIGLTALVADLAGYCYFSQYWLAGWGATAAVLVWAVVIYGILHDWKKQGGRPEAKEKTETEAKPHPVPWFAHRMALLGWLAAFSTLLLAAWDVDHGAFEAFFQVLSYSITFGTVSMNLLGVFLACLILWCTHALARVLAHVFHDKFLADGDLEKGFRESLTTLLTYGVWAVGILFALSALGVSSTSMAVVFGALGIGLGFGLQAIFNNFVSGLILLFERPIQVGDVLEVNGVWGEVKKINVRATVVQTYDNASLIIPNSEIISNQVTNWSFKDPRVRRNIYVGVAYGSDIALVRDTLQEVADKHPKVYRKPKPDVLFTDFADSALMFRLRFWSHVDHFLSVETEMRFEIDRLFRERGITIPFPQRDVHVNMAPQKED